MTQAKTSARRKAAAGETSWCKAYAAHSAVDGASKAPQPASVASTPRACVVTPAKTARK